MISLLTYIDTLALGAQAFIGLGFLVSSIWEREKSATCFAAIQFAGMLLALIIFIMIAQGGFFRTGVGGALLVLGTLVSAGAIYFFMRKTEPNPKALKGARGHVVGDAKRFDERKVVFARNRLIPGSKEFEQFYKENPDLAKVDAERRTKGQSLGTYGSIDAPNEKPNVSAMVALRYFGAHMAKPDIIRPKQAPFFKGHKEIMSPEAAAEMVKGYARHLGADLVGIAELDPLWVYSHTGTIYQEKWDHGEADWTKWGEAKKLAHQYAIVFAEEMDREMIAASPHTPVFVESMRNYAKGAFISTQLAAYIANLGYSATANHVQHYDLVLPPLAAAAGLGEVGRLGYLMTKEFGPRIRLSAVTTDLPLAPDKPIDIGAEDFCRICKKCADCCPSNSIPTDTEMSEVNGSMRWKLNAETCFAYWGKIGTDCCICMKVCPWSHARTWPHKIIVWLISRNKWSRRLFNWMDDIFYGRKPKPKLPPGWATYKRAA
jgi:reductive dehalogenase